jgi:hypothetical protein
MSLRVDYVPERERELAFQTVYEHLDSAGDLDESKVHQLHAIIFLLLANGALFDPACSPSVR